MSTNTFIRSLPSKFSFFTQNLKCAGDAAVQQRVFSSGRPVDKEKDQKERSVHKSRLTRWIVERWLKQSALLVASQNVVLSIKS